MNKPVYLDYAASTPADPRVAEEMSKCMTLEGNFGNPASTTHSYGWNASECVDIARNCVADLIGADSREIIFTSGATECDNAAIKGVVFADIQNPGHIVTSAIEHKAVLDTCAFAESLGWEVTYLVPGKDGAITPAAVEGAIRENTRLVTLMGVNNEIGTVTDIAAIGAICRSRGILFHCDAAQAAGKIKIDVEDMQIDMLSISSHKIYGPKGIGALYVRNKPKVNLVPLVHGGGHERGYRSGTLATHQIAGFGKACEILTECMNEETARISALKSNLRKKLSNLPGVEFHGEGDTVCGILNVGFKGVIGETLIASMPDIAVSSGSACNSKSVEPSYVLTKIGVPRDIAAASIRFSLGRFTTESDIDIAFRSVTRAISALKKK